MIFANGYASPLLVGTIILFLIKRPLKRPQPKNEIYFLALSIPPKCHHFETLFQNESAHQNPNRGIEKYHCPLVTDRNVSISFFISSETSHMSGDWFTPPDWIRQQHHQIHPSKNELWNGRNKRFAQKHHLHNEVWKCRRPLFGGDPLPHLRMLSYLAKNCPYGDFYCLLVKNEIKK